MQAISLCFAAVLSLPAAAPTTASPTNGDPSSAAGAKAAATEAVTYAKHVAPILWKNCASCHRPGEVGPFSLLTYDDAAKRAEFLAEITGDRRMPPWKAEPNFGKFHADRRMNDADLATIRRWADAGAPKGDDRDLPEPPKFVDGWQLGEPDLVLEMPEEFSVPADGADIYQCFVIPIPTTEHRTVAAAEFRAGNRRVVHHAIMYLDANGAARKRDAEDAAPGYRSFGGPGVLPTGGLGGWAPGAQPHKLPEGTGKFLRKGSDLVLQLHYHPSGKPEKDRSSVGIYFTEKPATTLVGGLAILNHKIRIPAGEKRHVVTAQSEPLPVPVNVLGIGPHMHLIGREMKVIAKTPDGETIPFLWIKDWDFNWQGAYGFAPKIRLPKGSVIHLEAIYDNSDENPHNPNSPPKLVTWGEQTTDEMLLLSVQLTTDSMADLKQVVGMRGARLGGALAGGVEAQDLAGDAGEGATAKVDTLLELLLDRGFAIPEQYKEAMKIFDGDGNGQINREEFDKIPEPIRGRIREEIRRKIREIAAPAGK